MGRFSALFIFAFILLFSGNVFSAEHVLQILHVNDIHSYWENNGHEDLGGVARIKTILDTLEAEGNSKGWTTIKLDAGDFSDGNINFLSQQGKISFKIERALNFDAVALGNHDYMTGLDDLTSRFTDPEQRISFVAANFDTFRNVGVEPGLIINRGGMKIAIGGATLKSDVYNWAAWPAIFTNPHIPLENWFATQPADIRIALTHLGLDQDRKLALQSKHIDVIIGGHSHTVLELPTQVFNKSRHLVPIAQAGSHGSYVGKMILRISEKTRPDIIDYQLVKVDNTTPPNLEIQNLVTQGRNSLKTEMHHDLNQVIAASTQDYPTHLGRTPLLGNFLADALRESTGAEIAIDSGDLYGERLKQGPVTIADIYGLAPHTYSWADGGWHIFTCNANPWSLRYALAWLASSPHGSMVISGMELTLGNYRVPRDLRVDGRPIDYFRSYKTAFSEGFVEALAGRPRLAKMLCGKMSDSGILIRDALVEKATRLKVFSNANLGEPRVHFQTK